VKRVSRLLFFVVVFIVLSMILTACGPASNNSASNGNSQTTEANSSKEESQSGGASAISINKCTAEGAYAPLKLWMANHFPQKFASIGKDYSCYVQYMYVGAGGFVGGLYLPDIPADVKAEEVLTAFGLPTDNDNYTYFTAEHILFLSVDDIDSIGYDLKSAIEDSENSGLIGFYKYAIENIPGTLASLDSFYITIPYKGNETAPGNADEPSNLYKGTFFRSKLSYNLSSFNGDVVSYIYDLFKHAGVDIDKDYIGCDGDACYYTYDEDGKVLYIAINNGPPKNLEIYIAGPWKMAIGENMSSESDQESKGEDNAKQSSDSNQTKAVFSDVINHVLDYVASPEWADVARHFKATYLLLTDTGVDGFENFPEDEEALCFDISGAGEDEVKAYLQEKGLDGEVHSLEGGDVRVCTAPKVGLTDYIDDIPAEGPFEIYKQFMEELYGDLGVHYGWATEMAFIDMHQEEVGHVIYFGNDLRDKEDDYTEKGMRAFIKTVVNEAFGVNVSDDDIYKDTNDDGSVDVYYVGQKDGYDYIFLAEDENADGQYDSLMFYVKASEDKGI